jgi:hypothetical protein
MRPPRAEVTLGLPGQDFQERGIRGYLRRVPPLGQQDGDRCEVFQRCGARGDLDEFGHQLVDVGFAPQTQRPYHVQALSRSRRMMQELAERYVLVSHRRDFHTTVEVGYAGTKYGPSAGSGGASPRAAARRANSRSPAT